MRRWIPYLLTLDVLTRQVAPRRTLTMRHVAFRVTLSYKSDESDEGTQGVPEQYIVTICEDNTHTITECAPNTYTTSQDKYPDYKPYKDVHPSPYTALALQGGTQAHSVCFEIMETFLTTQCVTLDATVRKELTLCEPPAKDTQRRVGTYYSPY